MGCACREVRGERGQILDPLAERGDHDREHGEPVEQVLAELARLDHRGEVAVGRRDDPHVDAERLDPADPEQLAVLDHAEQPHLDGLAELADLVEEERPEVGLLEPPLALRDRAGEGAALVTEQLGVDELGGHRTAVDAQERLVATLRALVDRAGDDLLAGARLAEQQDVEIARRDHVDAIEHGAESSGVSDDGLG